jgi:hypothetical protein
MGISDGSGELLSLAAQMDVDISTAIAAVLNDLILVIYLSSILHFFENQTLELQSALPGSCRDEDQLRFEFRRIKSSILYCFPVYCRETRDISDVPA